MRCTSLLILVPPFPSIDSSIFYYTMRQNPGETEFILNLQNSTQQPQEINPERPRNLRLPMVKARLARACNPKVSKPARGVKGLRDGPPTSTSRVCTAWGWGKILRQGISPETELATQSLQHLQAQEQNLMSAKLPGGEDGGAIAQR